MGRSHHSPIRHGGQLRDRDRQPPKARDTIDNNTEQPRHPRLGDLRRALAEEKPPPGAELAFDIPGASRPGSLRIALVIPSDLMFATLSGTFVHLPDSTPLEELSLDP